jgi:hypothetical protein
LETVYWSNTMSLIMDLEFFLGLFEI